MFSAWWRQVGQSERAGGLSIRGRTGSLPTQPGDRPTRRYRFIFILLAKWTRYGRNRAVKSEAEPLRVKPRRKGEVEALGAELRRYGRRRRVIGEVSLDIPCEGNALGQRGRTANIVKL